ncbi:MAG: hypothetical protein ACR2RF_24420 [Geminicoccaceae bacterium]
MTLKPIDRRWLVKRITALASVVSVGGAAVFVRDTFFAWRRDQREQEKHDLALADRQQGQVVEIGRAEEIDTARPLIAVRADQKAYLPTSKGSITVDPTIPI